MQANWIDRTIGYVAPERAAKRLRARARIAAVENARSLYEAASAGRRTQGWRSVGADANATTKQAAGRLRDVARDMVRNHPFAARAKATITHNVVGTGIMPSVKATRPARAEEIKALVASHCLDSTDIDVDGRHNLYGLQALAMATIAEAGEVLIRRYVRDSKDKLTLPFQLQVLEPDFIDSSVEGKQPGGNTAIQGIEFDNRGRRVAYHLFTEHPGSLSPGASIRTRSERVRAEAVAHIFRVDRSGQVRGVTWFAPVIMRMRDFAELCDAKLLQQKIACYGAFITLDEGLGPVGADGNPLPASPSGLPIEGLEPGMIERLAEGEKVTFATPPSTADFGPYSSDTLHEIAAGLNITYQSMTGNLASVNFSSGRMGWIEYQRSIDSWRWNMLIPQMMGPIAAWTTEAAMVETGSTEPFFFAWTPPRREMIDPASEIRAARDACRAGLSWLSEEHRKNGYQPDEVFGGLAEDAKRIDEAGLVLDSDPRKTSAAGLTQARPAGTEIPGTAVSE